MSKISLKVPFWPRTNTVWRKTSSNWFIKFAAFCTSAWLVLVQVRLRQFEACINVENQPKNAFLAKNDHRLAKKSMNWSIKLTCLFRFDCGNLRRASAAGLSGTLCRSLNQKTPTRSNLKSSTRRWFSISSQTNNYYRIIQHITSSILTSSTFQSYDIFLEFLPQNTHSLSGED